MFFLLHKAAWGKKYEIKISTANIIGAISLKADKAAKRIVPDREATDNNSFFENFDPLADPVYFECNGCQIIYHQHLIHICH